MEDMAHNWLIKKVSSLPVSLLRPKDMEEFESFRYSFWVNHFCVPRENQDPRDEVFAAHSLLPEKVRKDVPIDYNASIADVFEDIIRAYMKAGGPFPIMEMLEDLGHAPDYPSDTPPRVPDYLYFTRVKPNTIIQSPWHSPDWPHRTDQILEHRRRCLALGKYWLEDKGKEIEVFGYKVGTCMQQSNGHKVGHMSTTGQWRDFIFTTLDRLKEYYRHSFDVLHVKDEDIYSSTYTFG